jgi:Rha family phage regulatory protein
MNNELVQLTTQDIKKSIPVTSSRTIAEEFGKLHKTVLRDIRELIKDLEESLPKERFSGYKLVPVDYDDEKGEKRPEYLINKDLFVMLVMGYTGKKALIIKDNYIQQFNFMERELLARSQTRYIGKSARKSLTESIKLFCKDDSNFKSFAYNNYTKLIYKKITGMNCVKLKEIRKIPKGSNIRDYLTIEELERCQELESKIASIIEQSDTFGKTDKEVYKIVSDKL